MYNKYEVRKVKIGSFTGVTTGGHIARSEDNQPQSFGYAELDPNTIREILAIIDEKNGNAIDIFDGNFYHILQRDHLNRIIEKPGTVKANTLYALSVNIKDKFTDSQLFKIYCNSMATKAALDYEQKYEGNVSFQKVKRK